jgi:catechol 2,3-dioxygenase-like lactoylglutathione lyase family enzyme
VLDHVGVNVSDIDAARSFYAAALEPLGIKPIMEFEGVACGFGDADKPYFWIAKRDPATPSAHIAFHSPDRETVDAFHTAALAAGGTDNGEPGPRQYHPHYYGAFVLDPDGNNIEAVCHHPPGQ